MKLRKIFATAAMALFVSATAMAQTPQDIRIYINPGHGAFDANSRPMGTVKHGANNAYSDVNNDTANFFESNTNLQKGFGVLEKLIEYGVHFDRTKNQTNSNPHRVGAALDLTQQIVFSRVKSGVAPAYTDYETHTTPAETDYYDRTLSEISAEVEANNFDMFISIHSNAASGIETNYLYYAIDGYGSDDAKDALSKEMSRCGWNHSILDRHQQWTHYDYTMTKEDLAAGKGKIAKQQLGVLRHNVPGYLVEGYFHTYQPSRHRAMNWDVDRMEGVTYARGVADYFGWTKEDKGDIYGVVRDLHEKFNHEFYNGRVGTPDVYLPLNNVKVILKKAGVEVATYTTDDEYNGAFVFAGIEPGEYTVEFAHVDYKAIDPIAVTVEAAKTSYPTAYLENVNYIPPKNVYVNYPDSLLGKDYALGDAYNVDGTEISLLAEQLTGKKVRRQIVRDNKLYVLALDEANEPYIYLADLVAGTAVELDKAAVVMGANGILKISDIALTADHVLVATGMAKNQYSTEQVDAGEVRGSMNAYKWTQNEKTGLPETCELWFSSENSCNMYRCLVGKTIAYSGTLEDGILTASGHHATATVDIGMRFAQFAIVDGQLSSSGTGYIDCWVAVPNETYFYGDVLSDNSDFELMISPLNNDNFVIDGNLISPFEWEVVSNEGIVVGRNELINPKVNGANYFKYNGKTVMTAPAVNEEGKITGLVAFDITEGFDKATEIKVNGATIEPAEYTFASAHGELALEIDDSDRDNPKTVGAEIEFFLVVDGKVYKYTTAGVEQPATPNAYAYGLSVVLPDDGSSNANLAFNLTAASTHVDIILTQVDGDSQQVISLGALGAGGHSYTIDKSTLTGDYKWSVSVANKVNNGTDILFSDNSWGASADALLNGGVAVDNNPESDFFGNVYVSADTKGIYVYSADGTLMNETGYWAEHAGNLHRGAVSNGKFYVADNSSAKSGIWMLDPANPTVENQVATGNQPCAVSFFGEGEERDMYAVGSYTGASGSQLLKYENIGTADTWSGSPKWVDAADAKMFGSNHFSIITVEGGHLISQYRESSSNYAPGFFFIDNAGTVYNYATDLAGVLPGCKKSGMALSVDGSLFAIVGTDGQIPVFDVVWTNGVPAFTHKVTIKSNVGVIWGMAFDYANNLHCYNEQAGYCVHAVPCDANTVVTPAKMTINDAGSSAIEIIETEDVNTPVEYYNLQGVKVANPSNGIFIKKQGSKATKVVL